MTQWLAQLTFTHAAALWALLALPLIWWLLRTTPPRPREVRFPPFRLLQSLRNRRRQPARTPWWLLALRMALATALVLALAGPRLLPQQQLAASGNGPWLLVVDDGWAAARNWPAMRRTLLQTLDEARQRDVPVAIAFTTPRLSPPVLTPRPPSEWRNEMRALQPVALDTRREALIGHLRNLPWKPAQIIWLSDGIATGNSSTGTSPAATTQAFMQALAALGVPVRVHVPRQADLPMALLPPAMEQDTLKVRAMRAIARGPQVVPVILRASNGRPLAQADVIFHPTALHGEALIRVPPPLRNEAARLQLAGQPHAGGIWLLGDGFRRKSVLVISGDARGADQPLLSATYYVTRALAPFAEVVEETTPRNLARWLQGGLSLLVLADVGRLPPAETRMLTEWVRRGGVLLRFAGERIANANPALLPVTLRRQERALGASLSWQQPQPLGGFASESPLAGLTPDREVRIRRQVLAEPDIDLPERTWATLADGTPLITARRHGQGWLALVHVTASPDWSNLPLSGLFVQILKRINELAPAPRPMPELRKLAQQEAEPGIFPQPHSPAPPLPSASETATTRPNAATSQRPTAAAFTPQRMLTADGLLQPMPPHATPIPAQAFETARPSPRHPAGLYARAGQTRALNIGHAQLALAPLPALPAAFTRSGYTATAARDLAPPLFIIAAVLFLLDLLAMLWLATGGHPGALLRRRRTATTPAAPAVLPLVLPTALLASIIIGASTGLLPFAGPAEVLAQQAQAPGAAGKGTPRPASPPAAEDETQRLSFAMMAARNLRLAYVKTGDAQLDALAHAGLRGLSGQLHDRTAVEPDEPLGIDIERDDISFFPLLYWPVTASAQPPSAAALRKLDVFLKNGGTILFDTRDAPDAVFSPDGMTPQRRALQRILEKLDIPPLEPVPKTHVLTRSFFLLDSFPGRFTESELWVEATSIGRERRTLSPANADGVSAIIITGNDLAGAWAVSPSGQPLLPVSPGGLRQREMAYRTGINIVMYALTGNYKADQVHLPTILQRLGQ